MRDAREAAGAGLRMVLETGRLQCRRQGADPPGLVLTVEVRACLALVELKRRFAGNRR